MESQSNWRRASRFESRKLHILSLFVLFGFLVYGVDGNFPITGDDIHETSISPAEYARGKSLVQMYRYRNGLKFSYYTIRHNLSGGSFAKASLLMVYLFGASAVLFYFILSSIFSANVAWLGSMLYLAHSAKFEVLVWFAASMYVPVMMLLMATIWIAGRQWSPVLRGVLIGAIGWISMLFYEIFAAVFPAYFIIIVGYDYLDGRRIWNSIVGALIPVCVVATHVVILATASNPIWNRVEGDAEYSATPIVLKVLFGWFNSVDATFGVRHLSSMVHELLPFCRFYVFDRPILLVILLVVIALGYAMLPRIRVSPEKERGDEAKSIARRNVMGAAGLYLMLFSGIPSFLVSLHNTPSRLTFLPTIGLCIFLCSVLENLRVRHGQSLVSSDGKPIYTGYRKGVVFVFIWVVLEAATLSSYIQQHLLQRELDQSISERIVEIYPNPNGDETFFLNVAESEKPVSGVRSAYETGWAHSNLWHAYGLGINSLDFELARRKLDCVPGSEMKSVVQKWCNEGLNKVVPFYVSDRWSIHGIRKVVVVNALNQPVTTICFPAHAETRNSDLIDLILIEENDSLRLVSTLSLER